MSYAADLHLHSHLSRATSKASTLEGHHRWGQLKGLAVLATGDFTHPAWARECAEKLVPAEPGLYRLRDEIAAEVDREIPASCRGDVRFVYSVEISCVYRRDGRTRRVHNVVLMPDGEAAAAFAASLAPIGRLDGDGRPILKLDSEDCLRLALEASSEAFLFPAHVWTPHYSALGAFTAFESLEACYGDLARHVHVVETGLSSDPAMNDDLAILAGRRLISCSDAHGPDRLGREATLFHGEPSYPAMIEAMVTGRGLAGTVEFHPEHGKYHDDGHRACGLRLSPEETRRHGGICPRCGGKITVGVLSRIDELRRAGGRRKGGEKSAFVHLVPLVEILAEVVGTGEKSKGVRRRYERLLAELGPELDLLRHGDLAAVEAVDGPRTAEAIRRMRAGEGRIEAGYDGVYGRVRLLEEKVGD